MEVRKGRYNKLYDWEKVYFLKGVKSGKWDIKGNHLKDNNPYKNWKLNKNIVGKKKVKKELYDDINLYQFNLSLEEAQA